MKRFFAFTLAIFLVLTAMPASVFAAAWAPSGNWTELPVQVNPLYQGVTDAVEPRLREGADSIPLAETASLSEDQAIEAVRENMKKRITNFTISLIIPRTVTDQRAYVLDLFENALAHTGDSQEGDYLRWQYQQWAAGWSSLYTAGKTQMDITFEIYYYTTAQQESELDDAVDELLNTLDLYQNCDYQKISGIYDYLIRNITYDYENLNDPNHFLKYTAYAALVNKTSVCQGYAVLFYRLALELGVDARLVPGDSNGDGSPDHAWNIVELNNLYYCLDATFDAGNPQPQWFLLQPEHFVSHDPNYDYVEAGFEAAYPMSGEDFVHTLTETVTPPTCTNMGYTTYACNCNHSHTGDYTASLGHSYVNGICTACGANDPLSGSDGTAYAPGDLNLDGNVDSDDLTLLARHVGGIETVTGEALKNADVNGDNLVNSDDLTRHARYVGGIITSWDQE